MTDGSATVKCAPEDAAAIAEQERQQRLGEFTAPLNLTLVPWRHTKVVHFVRHGEGYHNVAGHADQKNYLSDKYFDAHLTPFGWQQAEALKQHISKTSPIVKPEVVIVSPLTRALETAIGAFGGGEWHSGDAAPPLMFAQDGEEDKVAAHQAVSSAGCPPFVAWEGCREHIGLHPCDKRHATEYYKETYPAIDFSLVAPGEDQLWQPEEREQGPHLKARGLAFVQWLLSRPEQNIAVVSHSSFLFFLMSNFGANCSPPILGELHRWYENCEMRTLVLSDTCGQGNLDTLWFPGGKQLTSPTF